MPVPQIPYTSGSLMMARQYVDLGEPEKAEPILTAMRENALQYLTWIADMDSKKQRTVSSDFIEYFSIFADIMQIRQSTGVKDEDLKEDYDLYQKFMNIYKRLN